MNKSLLLLSASIVLFSCSEPAPKVTPETVVKGKISNFEVNEIWLENYKGEKIIDTLNANGEFEIHFVQQEAACFDLVNGSSKTYVCLAPNDTIEVSFDGKNLNESISFGGKNGKFCAYLIEKQKSTDKLMTQDYDSLYYLNVDSFLLSADQLFSKISAPFVGFKSDTNISKALIAKEEKSLNYEKAALLLDYNTYYKLMHNSDSVPGFEKVLALTKDVNPNTAADLEFKSYQNYLQSYINYTLEHIYASDTALKKTVEADVIKAKQLSIQKNITDQTIKDYLQKKITVK